MQVSAKIDLTSVDSNQMTAVFSGGLVYEWTQEVSNYGLVDLSQGKITLLPDYTNLKSQFTKTPIPKGDGGYKSNGQASTCPANSTDFTSWKVLPAIPAKAQVYIDSGAGPALGIEGPTNQGAGPSVYSLRCLFLIVCRLLDQFPLGRILRRILLVLVVRLHRVLQRAMLIRCLLRTLV